MRLGAGGEALGKVHLHAKALRQVFVALLQHVILDGGADQHELDVHIHALGLQRHCRPTTAMAGGRVLDRQAAAAQEAAQPFPQRRIAPQVAQEQFVLGKVVNVARIFHRSVGVNFPT